MIPISGRSIARASRSTARRRPPRSQPCTRFSRPTTPRTSPAPSSSPMAASRQVTATRTGARYPRLPAATPSGSPTSPSTCTSRGREDRTSTLTFLNLPLVRREGWAWERRSSYTVGLVELHTDAGVTGIGEVNVCMGPNPEVIRAMTVQMAELFVGDTPLAPGRLIGRVLGAGWYPFHRTAALVLGGLEMACLDAAGKHIGQPVSTFFGGPLKTSFGSMYYIQAQSDLDAMVGQAR